MYLKETTLHLSTGNVYILKALLSYPWLTRYTCLHMLTSICCFFKNVVEHCCNKILWVKYCFGFPRIITQHWLVIRTWAFCFAKNFDSWRSCFIQHYISVLVCLWFQKFHNLNINQYPPHTHTPWIRQYTFNKQLSQWMWCVLRSCNTCSKTTIRQIKWRPSSTMPWLAWKPPGCQMSTLA